MKSGPKHAHGLQHTRPSSTSLLVSARRGRLVHRADEAVDLLLAITRLAALNVVPPLLVHATCIAAPSASALAVAAVQGTWRVLRSAACLRPVHASAPELGDSGYVLGCCCWPLLRPLAWCFAGALAPCTPLSCACCAAELHVPLALQVVPAVHPTWLLCRIAPYTSLRTWRPEHSSGAVVCFCPSCLHPSTRALGVVCRQGASCEGA